MSDQLPVSVMLTADIITKLNDAARLQGRPSSEIVKDAVEDYLDAASWLEDEIRRGLDDLNAGRSIPHDVIKEKYRALGIDVD